ncbi:MAG: hypothetical protein J4432_04115 [DPANN group archaeon]|nr:hypothetical protein [DPANN group archaeon]
MIVSQFPHFYQDKDGKSHRNMLQLEVEEPAMQGNFPKDGHVMIRLQDQESQKAFKMTPQETLAVGKELVALAEEQQAQMRQLWKSKAKP